MRRTGAGTVFDAYERRAWQGQAAAYAPGYGRLCAYTAPLLLDAAGVPENAGQGGGASAVRHDDGTGGSTDAARHDDGTRGRSPGEAGRPRARGDADRPDAARPRVLDVGTGPGTVAELAVARGARVTAVDAEPSMVAAAAAAVPQAAVVRAALPDLPFADGEFDAAVGNFVVNHTGRPRAALAELRRVTRPGGRIAVTIWASPYAPGQALLGRAATAAGVERPADVPTLDPADDFTRDARGLAGLLSAAGLAGATCRTLDWEHVVDPDVWWSGPASGIGALGQMLARLPAERLADVRRHYQALADGFRRPDGLLALPHTALLATAEVP